MTYSYPMWHTRKSLSFFLSTATVATIPTWRRWNCVYQWDTAASFWFGLVCFLTSSSTTRVISWTGPKTEPPPVPQSTDTKSKAEKVKRPSISASGTCEEWAYFFERWADYKMATKLSDNDIVFRLLESCDENLRIDLARSVKSIASNRSHCSATYQTVGSSTGECYGSKA